MQAPSMLQIPIATQSNAFDISTAIGYFIFYLSRKGVIDLEMCDIVSDRLHIKASKF